MLRKLQFYWLLIFCFRCTSAENTLTQKDYTQLFHKSFKALTDVIVYDIFSPPAAARVYAYPCIAAFEAARHRDNQYTTLSRQMNGFSMNVEPKPELEYNFELAGIAAFFKVAKTLIFSEDLLKEKETEVLSIFAENLTKEVYNRSIDFGNQVAQEVLNWSDKDNYKQTRTFPKHPIMNQPSAWQPTPPDYMDGIEPHWNKIRPMLLDTAVQFLPEPPPPFSMDKNSTFYKEVLEVYEEVKQTSKEHTEIAKFWDCNPYVSHHYGHVMFATKKITPGGHWMAITQTATQKAELNYIETLACYAVTSVTIFDAFIVCWDEKYRSNLIRPETVINQYIDKDWVPILQTPPFPEYTSGHSVVSSSASLILSELIGKSFAFVDSTEVEYGLPARSYSSFLEAAQEAAVSRIYGGIHYRKAVEEGFKQGTQLAEFIADKIHIYKDKKPIRLSENKTAQVK